MVATLRRPKTASVSRNAVTQANALLQDLPDKPKDKLSLREAVNQLQAHIREASAKGYSYEEIAQVLSDSGIEISASTLKNYLPSTRRVKEAAPAKARGRQSQSVQPDRIDQDATSESEQESDTPAKTTRGRGRSTTAAKTKAAATNQPRSERLSTGKSLSDARRKQPNR
jgi:transposase